jgi:hypothetical protein
MRISVRVEGRDAHEQEKDQTARERKRHVVAKKAAAKAGARPRLRRRATD